MRMAVRTVRGSGSAPGLTDGGFTFRTCAAIASESACESRRASSRVDGSPRQGGSGKGWGARIMSLQIANHMIGKQALTVKTGRGGAALALRLDLPRVELNAKVLNLARASVLQSNEGGQVT